MSFKIFRHFAINMIFAMLFVLAGCGSPQTAAPGSSVTTSIPGNPTSAPTGNTAPGGLDPCTLLTKADAESILGKPVMDATHPITADATFEVRSCEYRVTGGTALDNATLIYTVSSEGDAATAKTAFDTGKKDAQKSWNAAPVDVPGLGDEAYWVGGAGNNVSVLKGPIYITLSASTYKGDSPPAAIITLAKTVLSRLK
jgi:hypothetical protein